MLLYNPRNGATFETNSDDEWHVQVYLDMGWEPAPEPEPTPPGIVPEPVKYAPVTAKQSATERPAANAVRDEWADYVEGLGGDPEGKTIAELKAAADELEGNQPD